MKKSSDQAQKANKPKKLLKPKKSHQITATYGALGLLRSELKKDNASIKLSIKALEKKFDARFNDTDAQFKKIDARFSKIDARFNEIDARFKKIDARFDRIEERLNKIEASVEEIKATTQRILALVEEQNSRNRYVLDGYALIHEHLKNAHLRMDKIEFNQKEFFEFIKSR